jgi:CrcB protein
MGTDHLSGASKFAMVIAGSGLGGGLRFLVYTAFSRYLPFSRFPYATLTVNVAGCFLIAFISHIALTTTLISANTRLFLTVGVMGGLTTYSTFNYDIIESLRAGQVTAAAVTSLVTFALCLIAGFLGLISARALFHG